MAKASTSLIGVRGGTVLSQIRILAGSIAVSRSDTAAYALGIRSAEGDEETAAQDDGGRGALRRIC